MSSSSRLPQLLSKTRLYKPHVFQGRFDLRPYFEGWYFKIVDRQLGLSLCLIPGVAMAGQGDDHAFIQYADSLSGKSGYLRYPLDQVTFSTSELALKLGTTRLSDRQLEVSSLDGLPFDLSLEVSEQEFYPVTPLHPGIMGPFRFVPKMECYHGVHLVYGKVSGALTIDGKTLQIDQGEIYIEKDWGKSFPSEWIWLQASGFETSNPGPLDEPQKPLHLMFSLANIPWLGNSFNGHLGYVWWGDLKIGIGTYRGSKVDFDPQTMQIVIRKGPYHIVISPKAIRPIPLIAPSLGTMTRHMLEDLEAQIHLEIYREDQLIYSGHAEFAGFERCGAYEKLGTFSDETV